MKYIKIYKLQLLLVIFILSTISLLVLYSNSVDEIKTHNPKQNKIPMPKQVPLIWSNEFYKMMYFNIINLKKGDTIIIYNNGEGPIFKLQQK